MWLNAGGVSGIRVEAADERFSLLPAFSGPLAATTQEADGLDVPFAWRGADTGALAGKTVRLRFVLERGDGIEPRLFAAYFRAG